MTITYSLTILSDAQLLAEVKRLVAQERTATAQLIQSLMELDTRRLYLAEGCSSLFTYCTQVLHLSEHAAFSRIEVARAARRLPAILDRLLDGSITVTNARMLAPHLTPGNQATLLDAARHKSKREVEHIVAELRPQLDVPTVVRKLPALRTITAAAQSDATPVTRHPAASSPTPVGFPEPGGCEDAPPAPAPGPPAFAMKPLAPGRYRIQLTVSDTAHDHLRRAQDLLRHTVPSGDPAAIVERALAVLVEQLEKAKCAATAKPRRPAATNPRSRHIPSAVRRQVWKRDDGRCAFVGARGRCTERGFLEFHHVVPYAAGGTAEPSNVQLRCRAHNAFEAELFFGAEVVKEHAPAWG